MNNKRALFLMAGVIVNDLNFWEENFENNNTVSESRHCFDGTINHRFKIQEKIRKSNQLALLEPFNAYVKTLNEGKETIYYFCRRSETAGSNLKKHKEDVKYVSYMAPLGRLASLEAGSTISIRTPGGKRKFTILEKNIFKPKKNKKNDSWDAQYNSIQILEGVFSVKSLLKFLKLFKDLIPKKMVSNDRMIDTLDSIEKQELEKFLSKAEITKGYIRESIMKAEFRNQAILDSVQDEIFRLPFNTKIIVNGTAGSGKTTVVLKRLAQKFEFSNLSGMEQKILEENNLRDIYDDQFRNWILFTPNSDIKNYIKEALNLEGLPASEKNLSTWDNMRTKLSRKYAITKVGDKKGKFIRSKEQILLIDSDVKLSQLSYEFRDFYRENIKKKLTSTVSQLEEYEKENPIINKKLVKYSLKIFKEILESSSGSLDTLIINLVMRLKKSDRDYRERKKKFNIFFKENIEKLNSQNNIIFNEILGIVEKMESENNDDDIDEEDEDINQDQYYMDLLEERETENIRLKTAKYIKRAISWYSKNLIIKKSPKHSQYSHIISLLDESFFCEDFFIFIGQNIFEFQALAIISQKFNLILGNIPGYYKKFRSLKLKKEDLSYDKSKISFHKENKITELEIDIILKEMLMNARLLFNKKSSLLEDDTGNLILEDLKLNFYIQAIIDEATDFSEIQIDCMRYLTHPKADSIVLSGDIMQRITHCGLSSWEKLMNNSSDYILYSLNKVYRQSPVMLRIIKKIYEHSTRKKSKFISAFELNNFDPLALRYKYETDTNLKNWIVDRINEIYSNFNDLPTVAIFVPNEAKINTLYELLYDSLFSNSIDLEECHKGKIGEGNKVRIFSIEYIKGMEFEAVFIIDIDKIAVQSPDLVDKLLYVGLTRAASYLAITYKNIFPEKLKYVERDFMDDCWKRS